MKILTLILLMLTLSACDSWAPRRQLSRGCEIHVGGPSYHWRAGHHHHQGCCGTLRP